MMNNLTILMRLLTKIFDNIIFPITLFPNPQYCIDLLIDFIHG